MIWNVLKQTMCALGHRNTWCQKMAFPICFSDGKTFHITSASVGRGPADPFLSGSALRFFFLCLYEKPLITWNSLSSCITLFSQFLLLRICSTCLHCLCWVSTRTQHIRVFYPLSLCSLPPCSTSWSLSLSKRSTFLLPIMYIYFSFYLSYVFSHVKETMDI